jgi:hypothetical protein
LRVKAIVSMVVPLVAATGSVAGMKASGRGNDSSVGSSTTGVEATYSELNVDPVSQEQCVDE